jgi:hypothetical protein
MRSTNFQPKLHQSDSLIPNVFQQLESVACQNQEQKRKRRVNFDTTVRMVLIPSRAEYKEANLSSSLWYNRKELSTIEKAALVIISTGRLYDDSDDIWSFLPRLLVV